MAVGDVAKLIIHMTMGGSDFRPGLHFQQAVSQPGLASLITAFRTACEAPMRSVLSNEMLIEAYEAQDKVPGLVASVIVPVDPALPGTTVDPALPPQDAVLFSLKSALKSPRARGRVYWPGATEVQQATGALTSAGQTAWAFFAGELTANFVGTTPPTGWRLVNYSPEDLTPPKTPPVFKPRPGVVITPVATIVLDPTIRSQRRRQLGRGQ